MRYGYILAALVVLTLPAIAASPDEARTQSDKLCTEDLNGKDVLVSGNVREVGDDGFSQYMIIDDVETGCRVVVFVDAGDKPCPYGDNASIALELRKSDSDNVNYFDGGGDEPFACTTSQKN